MKNIEQVVLFDDKKKHIDSVIEMLSTKFPNINFLGFYYKGADKLTTNISKEDFKNHLSSMIQKVKEIKWLK